MPETIQAPKQDKKDVKKFSDRYEDYILEILNLIEKENDSIRQDQIRMWKRNDEYWSGNQFIFFNEAIDDWDAVGPSGLRSGSCDLGSDERSESGLLYDYVFNVYKAHGESIVAALTQGVPRVEFFPYDADSADDISSAKSKTDIGVLIQRHNNVKQILMEIAQTLFNQGSCGVYRYRRTDEKYGIKKVNNYGPGKVQADICPECGGDIEMSGEIGRCKDCGYQGPPQVEERDGVVLLSIDEIPKSRECIEVYGPLHWKVPYYCSKQEEFGYLINYNEEHIARLFDLFPDFKDEIAAQEDSKERYVRTPSVYASAGWGSSDDRNLRTVKRVWLRAWMFESLLSGQSDSMERENIVKKLKEEFEDGLYVTVINKKIVDYQQESMDKCWTIIKSGPSRYIHSDPLGQALIPIQEIKNQLGNLTIETIEHGIPTTFVRSGILDFDQYGQQEASPGTLTEVEIPPGQNINESFKELKLATPSKEIEVFAARLDEDAQFLTGDYPSIYGGPSEGKSRTLGEYVQSGNRALQRLGLANEFMHQGWKSVVEKSVNAFIE